jgi:small subunit ribosomal protein S6
LAVSDYELVLMLDPQAADEQRDAIAADAKSRIESGGELKHDDSWGLRKMAYEIRQRTEADYRYFRFVGDKALLDGLDHSLKITDGVLRFRMFSIDPDTSPTIAPPDTAQVMRREEDGERGRGRGGGPGGRGGPRRPRGESSGDEEPRPAPPASEPEPAAAPAGGEGEAAEPTAE